MGYPTAYLYPERGGALKVVSFDQVISDVFPTPTRIRTDAIGGDGGVQSMLGPGSMMVTIRRERSTSASLVRSWRNIEEHLLRGGRIGFSWDHAKTWAAYGTGSLEQGDTLAYTFGTGFVPWSASGALASGDEVCIESPNPELLREYNTVSSITSGQVTLSAAVWNTYTMGYFLRYSKFWPALFLPEQLLGQRRITSDRGLNYSLDLQLAVDTRILGRATPAGSHSLSGPDLGLRDTVIGTTGLSLEELLQQQVGSMQNPDRRLRTGARI